MVTHHCDRWQPLTNRWSQTDGTVPEERGEPDSEHSRYHAEQQWFNAINYECTCDAPVRCGDMYRQIVQEFRALPSFTPDSSQQLRDQLYLLRYPWKVNKCHYALSSPTSDVLHTPRELLPRLSLVVKTRPSRWPYLTRTTIDDVRAMTYIRCKHSHDKKNAKWNTLRARLMQYAATGRGTVAEAIVYNDCYWDGELAYLPASRATSISGSKKVRSAFYENT
jgi:hypothetical protein